VFHLVLYQPQIPPNTGNVIRLCANVGARLHLIEPIGFELEEARLRRAGLDYREWVEVRTHASVGAFQDAVRPPRLIAFSTRGSRLYTELAYRPGDALLFGPETRGLPRALLQGLAPGAVARIPLRPGNRSLNLSNAVAVAAYEAWRQLGFAGAIACRSAQTD